jgi:hypothetical protein
MIGKYFSTSLQYAINYALVKSIPEPTLILYLLLPGVIVFPELIKNPDLLAGTPYVMTAPEASLKAESVLRAGYQVNISYFFWNLISL